MILFFFYIHIYFGLDFAWIQELSVATNNIYGYFVLFTEGRRSTNKQSDWLTVTSSLSFCHWDTEQQQKPKKRNNKVLKKNDARLSVVCEGRNTYSLVLGFALTDSAWFVSSWFRCVILVIFKWVILWWPIITMRESRIESHTLSHSLSMAAYREPVGFFLVGNPHNIQVTDEYEICWCTPALTSKCPQSKRVMRINNEEWVLRSCLLFSKLVVNGTMGFE